MFAIDLLSELQECEVKRLPQIPVEVAFGVFALWAVILELVDEARRKELLTGIDRYVGSSLKEVATALVARFDRKVLLAQGVSPLPAPYGPVVESWVNGKTSFVRVIGPTNADVSGAPTDSQFGLGIPDDDD